jgi:mycothiol synthase
MPAVSIRPGDGDAADLVIDLDHDTDAATFGAGPVREALERARTDGVRRVRWWVEETTDRHRALAEGAGLLPVRQVVQLRIPLPLDERTDLPTRPFRPGEDDEAWLAVNNRAFHWHPEQGGWTAEVLAGRMQEPWFDPAGFLLHERDGRLAGFCWTKVHADADPPLGEIYVIAVDPDFAGQGLGRALTVAGLAHLADRGLRTGMLYTEADNEPARRLYDQLGFTLHHADTAFEAELAG